MACEIGAADELLATEMIFSGAFSDLSPAQAAALLSCFVFEENVGESAKLSLELEGCLRTMEVGSLERTKAFDRGKTANQFC